MIYERVLNNGRVLRFKYSKCDEEHISKHTWHDQGNYIYRIEMDGRVRKNRTLHRDLIPGFEEVDHIDGDTYNYTRDNLRGVTKKQNCYNKGIQSNNTSGYPGIRWEEDRQKWLVRIKKDGVTKNLGRFSDFGEALAVRQEAEEKYFGEFRRKVIDS